ncbi:MAG TPA: CheR family methyltransferase [Polyangiaceae bacterium]
MRPAATPRDIERFRSAVARHLGLAFDDSKLDFLGEVLRRRLTTAGENAAAYANRLDGTRARDELVELARELTVTETYFFRHFDQFRAFCQVALPERLARRMPREKVSILCAGCASGEEAYSLAMLADESFPEHRERIAVHALDVNAAALERATRARYTPWSLRETPDAFRRRWFKAEGREFVVASDVRTRVSFERLNLLEAHAGVLRDESYDVVFFRNVLMYFTPDAARSVVERLTRALVPGGYLFLGHAETLRGLSVDFHLCHTHDVFYYQRKHSGEQSSVHGDTASPIDLELTPPRTGDSTTSWIETIQSSSQRIEWLSQRTPLAASKQDTETKTDLHSAFELLREERFGDALARLDDLPAARAREPDALMLRASLLAHRGELLLAESACAELLSVDDLSAGAHYLLALCREGRGHLASAAEHDRMAAYLDEGFAMPRLHLGLIARRAGERDTARRELERAAQLLEREDPTRLLLFGGGFGREGLIRLCRGELARLAGSS